MPAPMIRETPLLAPMADSRVILLGSKSLALLAGEQDRERGFLSREVDRDLDNVPLRACFKELPRAVGRTLVGGVSFDGTLPSLVLASEDIKVEDEEEVVSWLPSTSANRSVWEADWEAEIRFSEDGSTAGFETELLLECAFALKALNISTGKSATPIVRLANVPMSAEAPPEIGSHGPSSVSYSRGR